MVTIPNNEYSKLVYDRDASLAALKELLKHAPCRLDTLNPCWRNRLHEDSNEACAVCIALAVIHNAETIFNPSLEASNALL